MYIAILSYGSWTLTGVTEEKNNRVVEVLLATLRPWQLLGGKVLGIGLLGNRPVRPHDWLRLRPRQPDRRSRRTAPPARRPAFPGACGSSSASPCIRSHTQPPGRWPAARRTPSRPHFPMTMLAVAGFFVSINALDDPTSMLARITSFIPFTAPFVVPIRQSLDGIGPVEHLAIGHRRLVLAIVVLVRLSARIYSGGLLRFGRRVKLKEAWRAAEL